MIHKFIILSLGIAQIIDGLFGFDLFSSDLYVKYLGKEKARKFTILIGFFLILISIVLFVDR